MELQPYLNRIAADLDRVTALADQPTRETSRRLAAALEPGLRLAMTELLADAAAELSARLGGTVIAVHMDGQQPDLQITEAQPAEPVAPPAPTQVPDETDDGTARITVRLPDGLKRRAEALAGQAQQSLNTWIVQAVRRATEPTKPTNTHIGRRLTGWA
ncbi:MAG TPA: toxin-antitoxin system HicB family antitoxin [Micropruina sp.]|nr:toxin-antitoxin system HicB family antitoxin [Micropruina sp.]